MCTRSNKPCYALCCWQNIQLHSRLPVCRAQTKHTWSIWVSCRTLGRWTPGLWVWASCSACVYRKVERSLCRWTCHGKEPAARDRKRENYFFDHITDQFIVRKTVTASDTPLFKAWQSNKLDNTAWCTEEELLCLCSLRYNINGCPMAPGPAKKNLWASKTRSGSAKGPVSKAFPADSFPPDNLCLSEKCWFLT